MDFSFTDAQKQIYAYGQQVAAKYDRRYWLEHGERREFPAELWRQLGQDGFLGILVPEEHGGAGLGMTEMALFIEGLAEQGFPLLLLVTGPALAMPALARFGTDEQKSRILPRLCRGEELVCFAITEADVGSNTANLKTRARAAGEGFRLSGSKDFTTAADVCDYVMVVARTTPREEVANKNEGFTVFLVPLDAPGLKRQLMDVPLPIPERHCKLFFDDLELGPEHVVGPVGGGMLVLYEALNAERIAAAAMSCGMGRYLTQRAADYARDRVVFDDPIGAYQGVQHPLARARTQVEMARLMTLRAAWQVDAGERADEAANMAKYASAEASMEAAEAALQTHGGSGYARESGIYDIYQLCRLLRSAPVNRERVLCFIAERTLGLPRSY